MRKPLLKEKKIKLRLRKNFLKSDMEYLIRQIDALPFQKLTSNVVEIAEKHRELPISSPFPGKYRYSRTPYMYEIAMCLSPQSPIEIIHMMKSAQGGGTAGSTENYILYKIMEHPGQVLALVPSLEFIQKWDERRLMPMLELSGAKSKLRSTYKKSTQHGGNGDAMGRKSWPGGGLDMLSFGQVNQLRNQSYDSVIIEEVDEISNTRQTGVEQGDLMKIADARTTAFAGRRKIFNISTPLQTQSSIIYRKFLEGDQRYYYICCPGCGMSQRLEWKNLKYEKNEHGHVIEESVFYKCCNEECTHKIKNEEKTDFLMCEELGGSAKWVPHNEEKAKPGVRSYHLSALYNPPGFDSWYKIAVKWVDAQGDPLALQAFANLILGEPFSDYSDAPPAETLHMLKGSYKRGCLPNGNEGSPIVAMLGCDIQAGNSRNGEYLPGKEPRIEASLWGFGLNRRSWLLEHYVIRGPVIDYRSGAFSALRQMIVNKVFPMQPLKIFIDSRYQTDEVRKFCDRSMNIFPVMGESSLKRGYFNRVELPGFRSGDGSPLAMYELNTNPIKRSIYNAMVLRRDPLSGMYPDGYMMFPIDLEHQYFEQMTSERPKPIEKNGRIVGYAWEAHGANEALDCTAYAREALEATIFEVSQAAGEEASNYTAFWEYALKKWGYQISGAKS